MTSVELFYLDGTATVPLGAYVKSADYDAIAARLADALKRCGSCAEWYPQVCDACAADRQFLGITDSAEPRESA